MRDLAGDGGGESMGDIPNYLVDFNPKVEEEVVLEAEVPADSDYLSLSRYLSFLVFT